MKTAQSFTLSADISPSDNSETVGSPQSSCRLEVAGGAETVLPLLIPRKKNDKPLEYPLVLVYCQCHEATTARSTYLDASRAIRAALSRNGGREICHVPEMCVFQMAFWTIDSAETFARQAACTAGCRLGIALATSEDAIYEAGRLVFVGPGPRRAHRMMELGHSGDVLGGAEVPVRSQSVWTPCEENAECFSLGTLRTISQPLIDCPTLQLHDELRRHQAFQHHNVPPLDTMLSTQFEIGKVIEQQGEDTLYCVAMNAILSYKGPGEDGTWPRMLEFQAFLKAVQEQYRPENPFTNAHYAADAVQALHLLVKTLLTSGIAHPLTPTSLLECFTAIIAARVGHLGITDDYVLASEHPLSIVYPTSSRPTLNLTLSMVAALLTDPRTSFSWTNHAQFHHNVTRLIESVTEESAAPRCLCEALVRVAMGHAPLRSSALYLAWAKLETGEMWRQGDVEKKTSFLCPPHRDRTLRQEAVLYHSRSVARVILLSSAIPAEAMPRAWEVNLREHNLYWVSSANNGIVINDSPTFADDFAVSVEVAMNKQPSFIENWSDIPRGPRHFLDFISVRIFNGSSVAPQWEPPTSLEVSDLKMFKIGKQYRSVLEHLMVLCDTMFYEIEDALQLALACIEMEETERQGKFRERFCAVSHQWVELLSKFGVSGINVKLPGAHSTVMECVECILSYIEVNPPVCLRDIRKPSVTVDTLGTSLVCQLTKTWMVVMMFFQGANISGGRASAKTRVGRGLRIPGKDPLKDTLHKFSGFTELLATSQPTRQKWEAWKQRMNPLPK